jgi:hypothetical protein
MVGSKTEAHPDLDSRKHHRKDAAEDECKAAGLCRWSQRLISMGQIMTDKRQGGESSLVRHKGPGDSGPPARRTFARMTDAERWLLPSVVMPSAPFRVLCAGRTKRLPVWRARSVSIQTTSKPRLEKLLEGVALGLGVPAALDLFGKPGPGRRNALVGAGVGDLYLGFDRLDVAHPRRAAR